MEERRILPVFFFLVFASAVAGDLGADGSLG